MTWAILATGPSMSAELAQSVRGKCRVVAVSDAWRLAPWADVLVSADAAWWRENPSALTFTQAKYGAMPEFQKIEGVEKFPGSVSGTNSGLLACQVAVSLGAKKVLLLGFDMHGSHYFGAHPAPLKNTTPRRFETFKRQFEMYRPDGVEIVNLTEGSGLRCYRKSTLEKELG